MRDTLDESQATWLETRKQQLQRFKALSFRQKLKELEQLSELAAHLRQAPRRTVAPFPSLTARPKR